MSAGHGVNFVDLAVGPKAETLVTALIVAVGIFLFSLVAKTRLARATNPLVPDEGLTIRNIADLLAGFVLNLADNVMGEHNRKYIPFVGTIFLYVLFCNFLGLIPGLSTPSDKLTFNFGISIPVFLLFNYWGIREHGLGGYLKHFWGPLWQFWNIGGIKIPNPLWLCGLLIFAVECVSFFFRPITLGIRLFANMTADHAVLQAFTNLTKFVIPLVFYLMGTFVCVLQAFVFSLLTMIYIRLAVAHDSHEEEHDAHH